MKKFMEEFKAFALRGNVMDMAIGVLIGGQLEGIVPSDRLYTSSWPESVRAFLGLNMQRSDPHDPGIAVHPFARAL